MNVDNPIPQDYFGLVSTHLSDCPRNTISPFSKSHQNPYWLVLFRPTPLKNMIENRQLGSSELPNTVYGKSSSSHVPVTTNQPLLLYKSPFSHGFPMVFPFLLMVKSPILRWPDPKRRLGFPTGQAQFTTDHGGLDISEVVLTDLGGHVNVNTLAS